MFNKYVIRNPYSTSKLASYRKNNGIFPTFIQDVRHAPYRTPFVELFKSTLFNHQLCLTGCVGCIDFLVAFPIVVCNNGTICNKFSRYLFQ